jgi:hypothetical protein
MIRLRTLTEKSIIDSLPVKWDVKKIMDNKPHWMLKTYYEQEKITFTRPVIDWFKETYPNFFEIDKPGIFKGWADILYTSTDYSEWSYERVTKLIAYLKILNRNIPQKLLDVSKFKKAIIKIKKNKRETVSKFELQSKNHGR